MDPTDDADWFGDDDDSVEVAGLDRGLDRIQRRTVDGVAIDIREADAL
jgi:hypothetical protein